MKFMMLTTDNSPSRTFSISPSWSLVLIPKTMVLRYLEAVYLFGIINDRLGACFPTLRDPWIRLDVNQRQSYVYIYTHTSYRFIYIWYTYIYWYWYNHGFLQMPNLETYTTPSIFKGNMFMDLHNFTPQFGVAGDDEPIAGKVVALSYGLLLVRESTI